MLAFRGAGGEPHSFVSLLSESFSNDKQKVNGLRSGTLLFKNRLTFDLEELATATRQEAYRTPHGKLATCSGNQLLSGNTNVYENSFLKKERSIIAIEKSSQRWELFKIYTC
jgi:hypothetical protein